jgi:hypothetical protein
MGASVVAGGSIVAIPLLGPYVPPIPHPRNEVELQNHPDYMPCRNR